jgi:glucosamine kinase
MQEDNLLIKHLKDYNELYTVVFQTPITILAESGGTKTDWRIKNGNEIIAFETCNFHPRTIEKAQNEVIQTLIKTIPQKSSLFFYGSGCLQKENQEIIKKMFEPIDFKSIYVQSDLIAAGKSIYGTGIGYVGILGTGSVLCKYNNEQIEDLLGGHGYLLGDEGSGYYFGKLAIEYFLKKEGTKEFQELVEKRYGNRDDILSKVYSEDGKQFIGQLQLISTNQNLQAEINQLHKQNMNLFLDKYLPKNEQIEEIGFVGSYAFYNKEILQELLTIKGYNLTMIVQKPIDKLITHYF